MEIINLGDRVTIPSKNVKGEIAFIGKTHFASGSWFGIILDDPIGKHNGTIKNKCYFKCPRNHGMFIKSSVFERERTDINSAKDKHCSLNLKKNKYPKTVSKQKTETSKNNTICKVKPQSENKNSEVLDGDNITDTKDLNTGSTKITECGDNDSDEKKIQFVRRYPNYLKASSKLIENHFCLNKGKDDKTDHETVVGEKVACNNDKQLVDRFDSQYKEEEKSSKRVIYPNYLKSSSKLAQKHLCCPKSKDMNYDGIKDALEKIEMKTSKGYEDNNDTSDNPHAYPIKYPYHQKIFSNFKANHSCATKRSEMRKAKSLSKKEDSEIPMDDPVQDIPGQKSMEIEEMKRENGELKSKLKSTELSLQEALNKYNEAEKEINHLKFDNECQRKQIKFQKNQLKILKMIQENNSKKTDFLNHNKTLEEKNIDEHLKRTLYEHDNIDPNIYDGKFDLKNIKNTQHVLEIEEKNRIMMQGLIELRNFLKAQCESQTIESTFESQPLNFDSYGRIPKRNTRNQILSESFGSPAFLNLNAFTTDKSSVQLKEYSEMMGELIEFNELVNEKRENVENWEELNLITESLEGGNLLSKTDLNNSNQPAVQSTQNSLNGSKLDINVENHVEFSSKFDLDSGTFQNLSTFKKNSIQNNKQAVISRSSHHFFPITTEMKENKNKYDAEVDGTPLESAEYSDKSWHLIPIEDLIHGEEPSLSSNTLIGEGELGKDIDYFESVENSSSKKAEVLPHFCVNLSSDSSMMLPKPKKSERKMPVSTELRQGHRKKWVQ